MISFRLMTEAAAKLRRMGLRAAAILACVLVAFVAAANDVVAMQATAQRGGGGVGGGGGGGEGVGGGGEKEDGLVHGAHLFGGGKKRGADADTRHLQSSTTAHGKCQGVNARDALPHTLKQLRRAKVANTPYAHVFIRDIFEEGYYRCILEALPHAHEKNLLVKTNKDRRAYQRISGDAAKIELGGRGARTQWRNVFWRDFSRTFAGSEMRDAWMGLFRRSLAPRFPNLQLSSSFGRPADESTSEDVEFGSNQFEIRLDLSRDGEGYAITPHTDAVTKAVSMLYYLPRDDSRAEMGTRMYRSDVDDGGYGMTWKNWSGTGPPVAGAAGAGDRTGGGAGDVAAGSDADATRGGRAVGERDDTRFSSLEEDAAEANGEEGELADVRAKKMTKKKNEKWRAPSSRRGRRYVFEEIEAAPFVPNAVFAFAPCRTSWHAVRPVVRGNWNGGRLHRSASSHHTPITPVLP